jgi:integrase/recombinase XerC
MLDPEQSWIDRFSHHLQYERQLSPRTIDSYRRDLETFVAFAREQKLERWDDFDSGLVRNYSSQCFRRGLNPRSIQRRLSAARSFYRYLLREKHVKRNPVESVSAPKAPKRLPGNLDADRMARMLSIPGDGPLECRDRSMLELLYSSGLRLAELASLNLGDLDVHDATVHVTGKGSKDRILPVGRQALAAYRDWLKIRGELANADETAVFVSQRGTRISHRSIQARVEHWAKQLGIDTKVYPHLFRHSFASHVLESSHDLRGVQELLGHANIATTQIYTHLDFQHLAQTYDKTHPRARRKTKR